MKSIKNIGMSILCMFFIYNVGAQTYSKGKIAAIKQELSASQQKELERADNYISSGEVFMQEVKAIEVDMFKEREIINSSRSRSERKEAENNLEKYEKDAIKKLIDATETAEKGYDIAYKVYENKLKELMGTGSGNESMTSKKLTYDAKLKFNDAENILEKLTDEDNYGFLSKQVKLSTSLKQDGIMLLIEAICQYVDCSEPVVENNNNNNTDNTNSNNSNNNSNNNSSNNSNNNNYTDNNNNSDYNNKNNGNNYSSGNPYIYFTVQIMAASKPLPSNNVERIYQGSRNITTSHHNGLWKYMVGRFDNYRDARLFQEGIGRDSFVVAIKDGERMDDIKQAIRETGGSEY